MNSISRCQSLLGTFVSIDIEADTSEDELLIASQAAYEAIKEVQAELSFHDSNSGLSVLNSNGHKIPVSVSKMLWNLLSWCLDLSHDSNGLFDVAVAPALLQDQRLPDHWPDCSRSGDYQSITMCEGCVYFEQAMALDFGGVAKGLAVDLAMAEIERVLHGQLVQATVNAGGDIKMYDWKEQLVGVINQHQEVEAQLMQQHALASSAAYYDNGLSAIYDPKSSQAQAMVNTVSVFARECQWADALTKVAVLDIDHPVLCQHGAQVVVT